MPFQLVSVMGLKPDPVFPGRPGGFLDGRPQPHPDGPLPTDEQFAKILQDRELYNLEVEADERINGPRLEQLENALAIEDQTRREQLPDQRRGECNRRPLVLDASTGHPHEDQSLRVSQNGNQARAPQSQQDESSNQNESNQNVSLTTTALIAPPNDWVMSTGFNPGEQSLQISAANQAAIQYSNALIVGRIPSTRAKSTNRMYTRVTNMWNEFWRKNVVPTGPIVNEEKIVHWLRVEIIKENHEGTLREFRLKPRGVDSYIKPLISLWQV